MRPFLAEEREERVFLVPGNPLTGDVFYYVEHDEVETWRALNLLLWIINTLGNRTVRMQQLRRHRDESK